MKPLTKTALRVLGATLGCALALGYVAAGRVPTSEELPGAALKVVKARSGELSVSPSGTLLAARDLRPGRPQRASMVLHNPTDVALLVRPRLVLSSDDLDRSVRLRVAAGGRSLFDGPLGELRREGRRALRIESRGRVKLTIVAAIARNARGYEAREAEAKLELLTRIEGR